MPNDTPTNLPWFNGCRHTFEQSTPRQVPRLRRLDQGLAVRREMRERRSPSPRTPALAVLISNLDDLDPAGGVQIIKIAGLAFR